MSRYVVDRERIEDAVSDLVVQFRQQNPGITTLRLDYVNGVVVTFRLKAVRPKKRHHLQIGQTVPTTGGVLDGIR